MRQQAADESDRAGIGDDEAGHAPTVVETHLGDEIVHLERAGEGVEHHPHLLAARLGIADGGVDVLVGHLGFVRPPAPAERTDIDDVRPFVDGRGGHLQRSARRKQR